MLPKKWGGVVDGKMKVYGVANVRVVDSSVFPYEFAAHLASVTFGMAEVMSGVVANESFQVPSQARVDDNSLGPQGSGAPSVRSSVSTLGVVLLAGLVGVYGVL
jgi:choline dehydrogenase